MSLPVKSIKSHFPIFDHRPELIYLDSAATSQKPYSVIQTLTDFYEKENASVHRGLYDLSNEATRRYEEVRAKVAGLIGASSPSSIAFTKGATESINIVAQCFLKKRLHASDKVVISAMEHHANLIPWQQVCKQTGAHLEVIPVDEQGDIVLNELDSILDNNTKFLALTHISNTLGTINPIEEIIHAAHKKNIPVLIDAAQSIGHHPVNVKVLDADFMAFSAHKMFGPFGTGVLYCREEWKRDIDPFNFGGGAIKNVTFEETEFLDYPRNLEAGTPNVSGVLGLGAAIDFIQQLDLNETSAYTRGLRNYFQEKIKSMDFIEVVGNPSNTNGIISLFSKQIHPHDIASFLAKTNIAVRAGHHCTQPLLDAMKIPGTVRVSFSIYNMEEDADKTVSGLRELKKFWS